MAVSDFDAYCHVIRELRHAGGNQRMWPDIALVQQRGRFAGPAVERGAGHASGSEDCPEIPKPATRPARRVSSMEGDLGAARPFGRRDWFGTAEVNASSGRWFYPGGWCETLSNDGLHFSSVGATPLLLVSLRQARAVS